MEQPEINIIDDEKGNRQKWQKPNFKLLILSIDTGAGEGSTIDLDGYDYPDIA